MSEENRFPLAATAMVLALFRELGTAANQSATREVHVHGPDQDHAAPGCAATAGENVRERALEAESNDSSRSDSDRATAGPNVNRGRFSIENPPLVRFVRGGPSASVAGPGRDVVTRNLGRGTETRP